VKSIKFSQVLASAKQRDASLWMLGDQLLADMGKPPKFFTTCQEQIEDAFPDIDDAKQWAQLWKIADAFPAETRMEVGIEAHIAAGNPAVLQTALTTWQRGSKLIKHIKFVKQALAMAADEEGFFRKRRAKREREQHHVRRT